MADRRSVARHVHARQGPRPGRRDPGCRCSGPDRGSVLMLMPAGVLVVLVLGSMAVDFSVVHLGEREVADAAAAAANDAVTYGIDESAVYSSGSYGLDPSRVNQAVAHSLAGQEQSGRDMHLVGAPVLTDTDGDSLADTVTVTVAMRVDYVFAGALPGAPDGARVEATATATARRG